MIIGINLMQIAQNFRFTLNARDPNFIYQIILVNTIISVAFLVFFTLLGKFKPAFCKTIVMLLTPPFGVICFFVNFIISLFDRKSDIDYLELTFSREKREFAQQTDYETEKEFVPLEEALIISDVQDKRRALLNVLKADVSNNMKSLVKALDNEDSETAHYAASALMDILQKYSKRLSTLSIKYKENPEDADVNKEYADTTYEYISSGVLGEIEVKKYAHLYVELIDNLNKYHPDMLDTEQFRNVVECLLKIGKYDEADRWATLSIERQPNIEQSYLNSLNVKYNTEQWEDFKTVLNQLLRSGAQLSDKGIGIVRFWNSK
jgi:tetratricopeptide (TPR) repeat protein